MDISKSKIEIKHRDAGDLEKAVERKSADAS